MFDGVLAAPGGESVLVPDALEIGGLTANAAAGGQYITAELENITIPGPGRLRRRVRP